MDWDAFDGMEELSDGGGSGRVPGLGDLHSELGSPSEQESRFDLDDDIEDSEVARVLTAAIGESTRRTLASDSGISVAAAMHPLVHERILRRRTTLQLPWEMPFYSAIFEARLSNQLGYLKWESGRASRPICNQCLWKPLAELLSLCQTGCE